MYTRLEIDDELMRRAKQRTGLATNHAVITLALEKLAALPPETALTSPDHSGRRSVQSDQTGAETFRDFDALLSRLHRHSEFSLFASQLGINET
jgi:hypothetical protein